MAHEMSRSVKILQRVVNAERSFRIVIVSCQEAHLDTSSTDNSRKCLDSAQNAKTNISGQRKGKNKSKSKRQWYSSVFYLVHGVCVQLRSKGGIESASPVLGD